MLQQAERAEVLTEPDGREQETANDVSEDLHLFQQMPSAEAGTLLASETLNLVQVCPEYAYICIGYMHEYMQKLAVLSVFHSAHLSSRLFSLPLLLSLSLWLWTSKSH